MSSNKRPYYDYDLSKMKDTKAGFINEELDAKIKQLRQVRLIKPIRTSLY